MSEDQKDGLPASNITVINTSPIEVALIKAALELTMKFDDKVAVCKAGDEFLIAMFEQHKPKSVMVAGTVDPAVHKFHLTPEQTAGDKAVIDPEAPLGGMVGW